MSRIEKLGGSYRAKQCDSWVRYLAGRDFCKNIVYIDVAACDDPNVYLKQIVKLRHLDALVVGGSNFDDERLRQLVEIPSLRQLVLDSTSVTDSEITNTKMSLPNLTVRRSQRRAIAAFRRVGVDVNVRLSEKDAKIRREIDAEHFEDAMELNVGLRRWRIGGAELGRCSVNLKAGDFALLIHLQTLKRVNIIYPELIENSLQHLAHLRSLEQLSLCDTQELTDSDLVVLSQLQSLQELEIANGRQITDDGISHLADLPLRTVYLEWCPMLTDNCLRHFREMRTLRELQIFHTQITVAGLHRLHKTLPLCYIIGRDGTLIEDHSND